MLTSANLHLLTRMMNLTFLKNALTGVETNPSKFNFELISKPLSKPYIKCSTFGYKSFLDTTF